MQKFSLLLILTLLFAVCTVKAEPYRRSVEFEWGAIEGAQSYEVELKIGPKVLLFQSEVPRWSGRLVPGIYAMRIRAKDERGVPASWSPPEEFRVNLEAAKIISPKADEKLKSTSTEDQEISFQWEPVGGSQEYVFELTSADGVVKQKQNLKDTQLRLKLPVAKQYEWKVKGVSPVVESDTVSTTHFALIGPRIPKPNLAKPENLFVRELNWQAPEFATGYEYQLSRFNPKNKQWETVSSASGLQQTNLEFKPEWRGGKYRFTVTAVSPLRESSDKVEMSFLVKNGDRSAAAEEMQTIRQSIDHLSGWYVTATYLITMVDYLGRNYDQTNSSLHYSAIGGSGRIGVGYLTQKSHWGFIGSAELSGINVEGSGNFTYAALEGNAVHRSTLSERSDFRHSFGLAYKELPETIGNSSSVIVQTSNLKTINLHYGAEYWYALTPKLGFQLNFHLYPSVLKIQTPTGEPISPTVSTQFGVLGSYRLQRNITGMLGYAYRKDQIDYKAQSGKGSAGTDDLNSVQLSGHYLNLYLEWAL